MLTGRIDRLFELGVAIAFARKCIEEAVGIAELVIEERPDNAGRQRHVDVAHLLAHLIPEFGNVFGRCIFTRRDKNHRFARFRVAAQEVQVRQFLNFLFQPVGHLLFHFQRGGAGIQGFDNHHPKRKRRIFSLSQPDCGKHSSQQHQHHQKPGKRAVCEYPFAQIEVFHG